MKVSEKTFYLVCGIAACIGGIIGVLLGKRGDK